MFFLISFLDYFSPKIGTLNEPTKDLLKRVFNKFYLKGFLLDF